jgi:hypothetical protein
MHVAGQVSPAPSAARALTAARRQGTTPSSSISSEKLRNGPHEDDDPERDGALRRGIDRDGHDDVGHDENLKPEQDRPPEVPAQCAERRSSTSGFAECDHRFGDRTDDQYGDARDLEGADGQQHEVFEHHGLPPAPEYPVRHAGIRRVVDRLNILRMG